MSGTLIFWCAAALLTAGLAALVHRFSVLAARRVEAGAEDPALGVYRRQLEELDDLAGRGLLPEAEERAARAEAARRLISAADRGGRPETAGGEGARFGLAVGGLAAAAGAVGLYLLLGAPGMGDQPFQARMKGWIASDLRQLTPPELAAVLREAVRRRPGDLQGLIFLGRAEMAANDPADAARSFGRARRIEPSNPQVVALEAEALLAAGDGKVSPEAEAGLKRLLALAPGDAVARYYLGKAAIEAGRTDEGLGAWRALAAEMPVGDPRRLQIEQEIAAATGQTSLAETVASADAPAQAAFIQAMVSRLAARLKAKPDDPDGWARLVRAYGVLGDKPAQARALAQARGLYAGKPQMQAIEEAAR